MQTILITFYFLMMILPFIIAINHDLLPQMQELVGSNPTEGKICFSHFTLFRVETKMILLNI